MNNNNNALRELIYIEKESRDDFGINVVGSLNQVLYDNYLLTRVDLKPGESNYYSRITKVFNDAYYVCTVLLLSSKSEYKLSTIKNMVTLPSVVLPMVHFYLTKLIHPTTPIKRFLKLIGTEVKGNPEWQDNFNDIIKLEKSCHLTIEPSFFPRREFSPEFLSTFNWRAITFDYDKNEIRKLAIHLAQNKEEFYMMIDAIKEDIKKYEFNKCEIDKKTGELILRRPLSLKSEVIYDLCDKIKEEYEKIPLVKETSLIDKQETDTLPQNPTANETSAGESNDDELEIELDDDASFLLSILSPYCIKTEGRKQLAQNLNALLKTKKKPLEISKVIRAAIEAGVISRPQFYFMEPYFKRMRLKIGRSSFNKYTNSVELRFSGVDFDSLKQKFMD